MSIAFDAVTSSTASSFSHTCTGSNRVLFVGVFSGSDNVTAVSYNGVAMSLLAKVASPTAEEVYIYYLTAPTSGSNTVAITGGTGITNRAVSYTGAAQTGIPDASGTTSVTATTATRVVIPVANNTWMIAFMRNDVATTSASSGSAQTRRGASSSIAFFDSNASLSPSGIGYSAGPFDNGGSNADWALVAATFAPLVQNSSSGNFFTFMK